MDIIYDEWVKEASKPGHITVIIGRKGSGKSATGYCVVEDINKVAKKDVYILGLPDKAKKLLPDHFKIVDDMLEVPNGSCVFIDEAAIHFSSKEWYKKGHGELSKLIEIARHKELSLVFVTLNTASVDVNVLRFVDSVLFKPLSLLQLELERQQMKKIIAEAQKAFDEGVPEGKDERSFCYVIGSKKRGMMETHLPTFWSDKLSTSYESFTLREDDEEWDVSVLMGSKAGQGAEWACADCVSWEEPEKEDGWCTLGFFDAPKKKCKSRVRVDKKPRKIAGKKNIKVKKNPQPAPMINIESFTLAHNEIPKTDPVVTNPSIDDLAGPSPNPPDEAPEINDYIQKMRELCGSYLSNPKGIVENLEVLQDEIKYNAPIDFTPDYDRFSDSLDRLREYKMEDETVMCPIKKNPSYPVAPGDYVRLVNDKPLFLNTIYETIVVHERLSDSDQWPSRPTKIDIGSVFQVFEIKKEKDGRDYLYLLDPRHSRGMSGCWGVEGPIHIDDIKYFEKVSAGEQVCTDIKWWQDTFRKIKTFEGLSDLLKKLVFFRNQFNCNFGFIDMKLNKKLYDPIITNDYMTFYYARGNELDMIDCSIDKIPKTIEIVDFGCRGDMYGFYRGKI